MLANRLKSSGLCRLAARPAFAAPAVRGLSSRLPLSEIPDNEDQSTGMEQKEEQQSPDIFWSREPINGPRGTKEKPAIIPSYNDHRVVGLETQSGVIWFRLTEGPLHLVANQYFKLKRLDGGDHDHH